MSNVECQWRQQRESETQRKRSVDVSRGALMNRAFEDSDLMAQSQDLELEVKARTCDEKCEQGSGH
jgi:hypothetical protein